MILVAGGTGRLGTAVVNGLRARGHPVRVLTRDPSRAAHLEGSGVDVAYGDLRDPASVAAAVHGARAVVSTVQGFAGPGRVTPASVDRDGNVALIEAAARSTADVILMSIVGAAADHPLELFRMKAAAEEALRASNTGWTIVRATAFVELHLDLLRRSAGRSGRPVVFGRGENPNNFVAVAEVASVVIQAVTDAALRGQVVEVGGAENLTFNELAARALPDAAGRPPRHIPRGVLRALAATGKIGGSKIARQAHTALYMDTADMTFQVSRMPPDPATMIQ